MMLHCPLCNVIEFACQEDTITREIKLCTAHGAIIESGKLSSHVFSPMQHTNVAHGSSSLALTQTLAADGVKCKLRDFCVSHTAGCTVESSVCQIAVYLPLSEIELLAEKLPDTPKHAC